MMWTPSRRIPPPLLQFGAAAVLVALAWWLHPLAHGAPWIVSVGITLALFAALLFLAFVSWRRLDEAAREAHKAAWWWGGLTGMSVAASILMGLQVAGDRAPLDLVLFPGVEGAFASGFLFVVIAQTVGYGLFWAGWWLTRR